MKKQLHFQLIACLIFLTSSGSSFFSQTWQIVGTAAFSAGTAQYTSLAFSPTGEPHVAYNEVTVKKFDGSNWVNVGAEEFSAGAAEYTSLAFNPTGELYVAYQDNANQFKATVMKFEPSSSIESLDFTNSVSVHPNPTSGILFLSEEYNIALIDLTGKTILEGNKTNSMDISMQPRGIYFILLTDDQERIVQRFKVTKE